MKTFTPPGGVLDAFAGLGNRNLNDHRSPELEGNTLSEQRTDAAVETRIPEPVGHYSHVVELPNGMVYMAGQKAWKYGRGTEIEGDITEQTHRVMDNIEAILASVGLKLTQVTRIQCCLANIDDFAAFERVYSSRLGEHKPARVTLGGLTLRGGALVELIVEAYRPQT